MSGIKNDFLSGVAMSSVPIYILTKYFFENNLTTNDFDFKKYVTYLPLQMGIINVIIFVLLNKLFPEYSSSPIIYPIILGTLMSIVLSMLTPTFNEIPKKVIKMKNENLYHLYSVAIFAALYFILLQLNK
jgi:hypothetical protein